MRYPYVCPTCKEEVEKEASVAQIQEEPEVLCPRCLVPMERKIASKIGFIGPKNKGRH